jgi:hypothetical protein
VNSGKDLIRFQLWPAPRFAANGMMPRYREFVISADPKHLDSRQNGRENDCVKPVQRE